MYVSEDPCTSSLSATMAALQKRIFDKKSKPLTVSTQELNAFHTIDRKLFTKLVLSLGRHPAESAQVTALWMWLEHNANDFNLVFKALLALPHTLLNALADESALICIRSNVFPFSGSDTTPGIPLLQAMSNGGVTLGFFHENRREIARGVIALLNNVCLRVFEDLLFQESSSTSVDGLSNDVTVDIARGNVQGGDDDLLYWNPQINSDNLYYLRGGFDHCVQRQDLNKEMEEVMSCLNLNDHEDQEVVPPHDRSIFLTFSKGHPITENELREFFTRRFGEIVDEIFMPEDKEPLYARLVLHSASSSPVVLGGRSAVQFCIDSRNVRVRKYVPRQACAGSPFKSQTKVVWRISAR